MENTIEDIEAAKRLKETAWFPALKGYYEPKDVIRYYDEVERLHSNSFRSTRIGVVEPEKFFTPEILKEGILLLDIRNLDNLKSKLEYIKNVDIPNLEKEIEILTDKINQ